MQKMIHWFMEKMVVKKGTSRALLHLSLWSIIKYLPISGSVLVFYSHFLKYKLNLTDYMNVSVLLFICVGYNTWVTKAQSALNNT